MTMTFQLGTEGLAQAKRGGSRRTITGNTWMFLSLVWHRLQPQSNFEFQRTCIGIIAYLMAGIGVVLIKLLIRWRLQNIVNYAGREKMGMQKNNNIEDFEGSWNLLFVEYNYLQLCVSTWNWNQACSVLQMGISQRQTWSTRSHFSFCVCLVQEARFLLCSRTTKNCLLRSLLFAWMERFDRVCKLYLNGFPLGFQVFS